MADADFGRPDRRWTVFAGDARTDGFSSVTAVPMRVRGEIIGAVSVLRDRAGHLSDETLRLMRALTNAASAGLIVHRDPDCFLLAVHEAAANAQEHGSGGRLWLWRHAGRIWCEISDDGPGLPADFTVHTGAPPSGGLQHSGLWLIHRICPDVEITSSPGGGNPLADEPSAARPIGGTCHVRAGMSGPATATPPKRRWKSAALIGRAK